MYSLVVSGNAGNAFSGLYTCWLLGLMYNKIAEQDKVQVRIQSAYFRCTLLVQAVLALLNMLQVKAWCILADLD